MAKKIRLGIDSLSKIKQGVNILAEAVKVTLGPKGRTVILHRGLGSPHVTKDGVTVAKDVEFDNSVMDMASKLVKQVARNTAESAGDGTTTSITLINAMFNYAYEHIVKSSTWWRSSSFSNVNPMDLKKGMEVAVNDTLVYLKSIAHTVQNSEDLRNIAMISSNGDESMGQALYDVYDKLGNGVRITRDANPSTTGKDEIIITEGFNLDRGYASPSFTNFRDNTVCRLENPIFALFPGILRDFDSLLPFMETSFLIKRPLVVIADDFDPKLLDVLVKNNLNPKSSSILALKTPGMGDRKGYHLEDIAAVVDYKLDMTAKNTNLLEKNLGSCTQIISTSYDTTIMVNSSNSEGLQEHLSFLKTSAEEETSDYLKSVLEERVSKLQGKMAMISLHATTDGEMLERIDRLDDAIEATKSAIEEGYIAGGGLPLYRISETLNSELKKKKFSKDFTLGYKSVLEAIKEPFNSILINGGYNPSKIYKNIPLDSSWTPTRSPSNPYFTVGFDSRSERYQDLVGLGIIDPVKVTRIALQNAVSTSGVLLTTGCTISLN